MKQRRTSGGHPERERKNYTFYIREKDEEKAFEVMVVIETPSRFEIEHVRCSPYHDWTLEDDEWEAREQWQNSIIDSYRGKGKPVFYRAPGSCAARVEIDDGIPGGDK